MNSNNLYLIAEKNNINICSFGLNKNKSVSAYCNDNYYIGIDDSSSTLAEVNTCLAHELGHCVTGAFYNMYSECDIREKSEYKANKWAIKKLIPKNELIKLQKNGYSNFDVAEYFSVTQDFLNKAISFYTEIEEMN